MYLNSLLSIFNLNFWVYFLSSLLVDQLDSISRAPFSLYIVEKRIPKVWSETLRCCLVSFQDYLISHNSTN